MSLDKLIENAEAFARKCDPFEPDSLTTTGTCAHWRDSVAKEFRSTLETEQRAALELGPCGKHPRMFWNLAETGAENGLPAYCTLCAEIAAAYERGKWDVAKFADATLRRHGIGGLIRGPFQVAALALQDRGT